jgi:hypothetical protein
LLDQICVESLREGISQQIVEEVIKENHDQGEHGFLSVATGCSAPLPALYISRAVPATMSKLFTNKYNRLKEFWQVSAPPRGCYTAIMAVSS